MWADSYVGLPFAKGGRDARGLDCYGLVRLVLAERAGVLLDRFDDVIDVAATVQAEAPRFSAVEPGQERPLDVVIMNEPALQGGRWVRAPVHMGVIVMAGLVLHINRAMTSRIDRIEGLDVAEIRRVVP